MGILCLVYLVVVTNRNVEEEWVICVAIYSLCIIIQSIFHFGESCFKMRESNHSVM